MREFLRRCPSCRRRFDVRLQARKLVDSQRNTEQIVHEVVVMIPGRNARVNPGVVTYENVSVEKDTFDVTYECHHCHYRWTETITKVKKG